MPIHKVFHPAAIVAAVVYWLWGWVWYTVFSAQWLNLIHKTATDVNTNNPLPYVISIAMAFALAYGTAIALSYDETRTIMDGIQFGTFIGFLFLASTMLTQYTWEGRPPALWVLNGSYEVVGLVFVGAIIGGWKKKIAAPKPAR